jgi:hypothetical protein
LKNVIGRFLGGPNEQEELMGHDELGSVLGGKREIPEYPGNATSRTAKGETVSPSLGGTRVDASKRRLSAGRAEVISLAANSMNDRSARVIAWV